jgi:hypothetical protein
MNNIQLKIKLIDLKAEFVGKDGKILVSGNCKFQFYDKGQNNVQSMGYRAFGQTALILQEAGKDSVHVISGSLNIEPPNEKNPNHSMSINISKALPVTVTKSTKPEYVPVTSTIEVPTLEKIPF